MTGAIYLHGEVQVSLFVAGAALGEVGEVQVSLFVAGAARFAAGAAFGEVQV